MKIEDIKKLKVNAGDVVIITFPSMIAESAVKPMQKVLKKAFPDNRCLVISGDASFGIVSVEK